MRGKTGLFSLFTSLPDHPDTEDKDDVRRRRRRRHSSGGDRETWSRKVEYFFAGLGYAVGLGNIWRFPYLCYRNGGGAFLIPYILALIAVGLPLIFMEMSFGQFASLGPITIWRICPLFKGIGYAIVLVLMLVNTYYNVLIAYALFYLFASITDELPWSRCDNKWNTKYCIIERCTEIINATSNATGADIWGETHHCTHINSSAEFREKLKTPTEEFFENHLLKKSDDIGDLGSVQWPLIVCLAVSWFTCFMCLFKGIKSMGKAVIFTTIFSYVILTVLLIRGLTLPGAVDGIIFYLKPDWKKLGELQVWGEASAQAFASLSLGGGGWITLSSYNKFKNRCSRDSVLVGIGNALTSLYAGFVIFSVLGYMAYVKGVSVAHVTKRGPGLAFVAYPEGLSLIPGAPFWAICFFFMMFTVGLDSLFGQVETIVGGIIDEFPEFLRPRRKIFTLFMCVFMFFMGIPLITQAGIYIVTLMDWFTLLFSFSIISLFEVLVITYIYGFRRFSDDIKMMLGSKPNIFYMVTWLAVSPITLVLVIIFLFVRYIPPEYGTYTFPPYALSIGWLLALGPCALIPITMVIMFFYRSGGCDVLRRFPREASARRELYNNLLCPTDEWGPALPDNFRKYSASHGKGTKDEGGDDDVFSEGCELTGFNKNDPENRIVKFSDEQTPESEEKPVTNDVTVEISGEKGNQDAKEQESLLTEKPAEKKETAEV